MALEREMETYRRHFESLKREMGKFVLIHGDEVVSTFNSFEDALKAGYARFKLDPFLINEIESEDSIHYVTREALPVDLEAA